MSIPYYQAIIRDAKEEQMRMTCRPHTKYMLTHKMSVNVYEDGSFLICEDDKELYTLMVYLSAKAARRLRKLLPKPVKSHTYNDERNPT